MEVSLKVGCLPYAGGKRLAAVSTELVARISVERKANAYSQ